jgi:hypothetical protein
LLTSLCGLWAQELDSLPRPSVPSLAEIDAALILEPRVYEPRKALLWALIPAGGQIYNRRWWKVPLVFGGFSGMLAVLEFNQANYRRFEKAYRLKLAGDLHEFSGTTIDSESRLLNFRNQFNKGRQSAYFYIVGFYLLQGVEAYVDAHLRNFDIDEDLSLRPSLLPTGLATSPTLGLGITYRF